VSNAGLRQGLADRGYEIGRNLMLEERYADGHMERIAALIDELIALKVNVLVTVGTELQEVRGASIPLRSIPRPMPSRDRSPTAS
jgi:hypothetical protein